MEHERGAVAASIPSQRVATFGARAAVWIYLLAALSLICGLGLIGGTLRATQAGYLALSPTIFYALLTLHGAGMLVATLILVLGAHWWFLYDVLELKVTTFLVAFGFFLAGVLLVAVAVLIGHFAAAWTFLYPLPFVGTFWPAWATGAYLLGLFLVSIGFALYCFDLLAAIVRVYGSVWNGLALDTVFRRLRRPDGIVAPPTVLAATMVALDGGLASMAGMVLSVALLTRWAVPAFPLDPLWAKNLTYFFGHTIANLTIYAAAGVVYALLPHYTNRSWKTSNVLSVAWIGSLTLVLVAFPHHLYQDFVQPPALQVLGEAASYLASVPPAVVTIFGGLLLIYRSGIRWTLGSAALFTGLLGWAVGGSAALLDATIPFNFVLHNTLWVPAHFHTYLLGGVVLFGLGFVSYFIGEGKQFAAVARWGFALFIAGTAGFVTMFYASGLEGVPRRYAIEPTPGPALARIASWSVLVIVLGGLLVLLDMVRRAARRNAPL
ncbi:MAG: cbb3-type cytochrome c oxidase subunit I [Chloroflexi bacterium]|nr:cbb3-type cytochrome c oxidase subunit I [Chloroflexota bacterium]